MSSPFVSMGVLIALGTTVALGALALFGLAFLIEGDEELNPPPPELGTAREARTAYYLLAAALPFLLIGSLAFALRVEPEGLVVLPVAALVLALWAGLRMLLASGAAPKPAESLIACGVLMVLIAAMATPLALLCVGAKF